MATGQTIINRALRLLGQIPANTDAGTDESADALVALNAMIDSWTNEKLMCYAYQDEALTMASGTNPYTIGSGGDLNTTRPVEIADAYIVSSSNSYPVHILNDDEYDAIPAKTTTGNWPDRINYRPTMATGTLYVYPVSDGTSAVLHLRTRVVVSALTLAGTISLPPGWEEALASNLAIDLAPEYETEPRPSVIKMATDSKANIKRINGRPMRGYTELPGLIRGSVSNILTNL